MNDWFTWIVVTILWWMFDYNAVMISFSFLEIWIQEDLVFNFFFLRLLEGLMFTSYLYNFLTKFFLLLTFTPTYWLKLTLDLNCLCMLVHISELERYYHWVLSIWSPKTHLHLLYKLMGTGLIFYAIWGWLLVLTIYMYDDEINNVSREKWRCNATKLIWTNKIQYEINHDDLPTYLGS
jgi:hypothetical protein